MIASSFCKCSDTEAVASSRRGQIAGRQKGEGKLLKLSEIRREKDGWHKQFLEWYDFPSKFFGEVYGSKNYSIYCVVHDLFLEQLMK